MRSRTVWALIFLGLLAFLLQGVAWAHSSQMEKEVHLVPPVLESPQMLQPSKEPRKFSIRLSGTIA